jgi:hypothetical protein
MMMSVTHGGVAVEMATAPVLNGSASAVWRKAFDVMPDRRVGKTLRSISYERNVFSGEMNGLSNFIRREARCNIGLEPLVRSHYNTLSARIAPLPPWRLNSFDQSVMPVLDHSGRSPGK